MGTSQKSLQSSCSIVNCDLEHVVKCIFQVLDHNFKTKLFWIKSLQAAFGGDFDLELDLGSDTECHRSYHSSSSKVPFHWVTKSTEYKHHSDNSGLYKICMSTQNEMWSNTNESLYDKFQDKFVLLPSPELLDLHSVQTEANAQSSAV